MFYFLSRGRSTINKRGGGLTQGTNLLDGGVQSGESGGMPPPTPRKIDAKILRHFHIYFCLWIFYILWLSAAFANGKVLIGSDNQHLLTIAQQQVHVRIIMLKLEN